MDVLRFKFMDGPLDFSAAQTRPVRDPKYVIFDCDDLPTHSHSTAAAQIAIRTSEIFREMRKAGHTTDDIRAGVIARLHRSPNFPSSRAVS